MYLLDTVVLSELRKRDRDHGVVTAFCRWIRLLPADGAT